MTKRLTPDSFLKRLQTQLEGHKNNIVSDPQANAVKLLAYDVSKDVEDRQVAFRHIEELVKVLSDKAAIARAQRLRERAGADRLASLKSGITKLAKEKAKDGFAAFKLWAETPAQGIVLTAHPTFSLSRDIRNCLGEIASHDAGDIGALKDTLKTYPYLPKRAPTLIEEHEDTQATLFRIQTAIDAVNAQLLDVARKAFPKEWTTLTPHLVDAYSWVGYDIDGRTDISWGDALRLRLSEKKSQLARYLAKIDSLHGRAKSGKEALAALKTRLEHGLISAERDLALFEEDISQPENLVAAANNLTRETENRFLDLAELGPHFDAALASAESDKAQRDLLVLRANMQAFGLGTARIHFRLNARHVMSAIKPVFGVTENGSDNRTLIQRASKLTKTVKAQPVNFASLALEKNTAHEKMILTAQIHKYIDNATPIRLLIAETEDELIPLGMLYLARLYGLEKKLDISPLFETADALNNGGRIIGKMLSNPVYQDYLRKRGVFAIQTGFSDAGRFMGQIPATLAIERLQSHFAAKMEQHGMAGVAPLVFNTHGEGLGRGGHPGNISERLDYAMSPWAIRQFEKRDLDLIHETSFQGGDGFLWFQTDVMAGATVRSLLLSRFEDRSAAEDDVFYTENDFSWDVFRTIGSEQDSLYRDPNYVGLLGGFGQNMLIPTGSRAVKRAKPGSGEDMFNPRQLRAIPHNAILQQFGTPANIFYGVGRAAGIDPEKFAYHFEHSARARSIFGLVVTTLSRTNLSILTGYGRLFDPGFWISRALSGNEPFLARQSVIIAEALENSAWRSNIMDLGNRLRLDLHESLNVLGQCDASVNNPPNETLMILHALRLAVIMKMMIIVTDLPIISDSETSRLSVLQKLQTFQIERILEGLRAYYPESRAALEWTEQLLEKTDRPVAPQGGFPHITETVIKPLQRASELTRQITIAITHHYDAFG